jgi:hypothetical protein
VALAASLRAGSRTTMIARVCWELLQEWRLQNRLRVVRCICGTGLSFQVFPVCRCVRICTDGKYMTDYRNEFPASWFARARKFRRPVPSQRLIISASMLASPCRFGGTRAGFIPTIHTAGPMVLSVLRGPPHDDRRCAPDQALEGNSTAHRAA